MTIHFNGMSYKLRKDIVSIDIYDDTGFKHQLGFIDEIINVKGKDIDSFRYQMGRLEKSRQDKSSYQLTDKCSKRIVVTDYRIYGQSDVRDELRGIDYGDEVVIIPFKLDHTQKKTVA